MNMKGCVSESSSFTEDSDMEENKDEDSANQHLINLKGFETDKNNKKGTNGTGNRSPNKANDEKTAEEAKLNPDAALVIS